MRLTLILPVYNERENLAKNFPKIYKEVKKIGDSEIIIAEDGSNDGTQELAARLSKSNGVRVLSSKQKLGRGMALKNATKIARGRVIGYIDIDLAVPLSYVPVAVKHVEDGNKVVVGSRYEKTSQVKRSAPRFLASATYNFFVFLFLGSKVKDHQCGFKFWDSKFIKKLAPQVKDNHWFFDTEMIVRSERMGIEPMCMPVKWGEQANTKVRFSDIIYFIGAILKLFSEDKQTS